MDIVDRLRSWVYTDSLYATAVEAAEEIERLRAVTEPMPKALESSGFVTVEVAESSLKDSGYCVSSLPGFAARALPPLASTPAKPREGKMRATLNFTLPNDDYDFAAALCGRKAVAALVAIDNRCRAILKHGDAADETEGLLREIRAMIPSEVLEIDT